MNCSGGGASGTGGTGSTSFFNGTAAAGWGNGGMNNGGSPPLVLLGTGTESSSIPGACGGILGGVYLTSNTNCHLGCRGCDGFDSRCSSQQWWWLHQAESVPDSVPVVESSSKSSHELHWVPPLAGYKLLLQPQHQV